MYTHVVSHDKNQGVLSLSEFKKVFDPILNAYLENKLRSMQLTEQSPHVRTALGHILSLASKGKRIRPYMAYVGYRLAGGTGDVWGALVGIELFHIFALIHDDVIDESPERHGVRTVHSVVGTMSSGKITQHIANAQAILVGDVVFGWAHDALLSGVDGARLHDVRRLFMKMIEEVVVGQMIDVEIMTLDQATTELIQKKNLFKTARYTFVNPLKIGFAMQTGQGVYDPFFEEFGEAIGLTYQIQDDLLDIIGNEKQTGKSHMKDFEDGQHTYFTQYVFDLCTKTECDTLRSYMNRKLSYDEKIALVVFLENTGAIREGKRLISLGIANAENSLKRQDMPSMYKQIFSAVISIIKNRNA